MSSVAFFMLGFFAGGVCGILMAALFDNAHKR
jgi:hypothetical protein